MNFIAIDTSAKYLSVSAYAAGRREELFYPECAMKHSTVLMDAIDTIFSRAHMSPADCDFFAAVTGPGSFTGIRIGIATVKGLCLAVGKPALGITSFDVLAYAERSASPLLTLVDAGHGMFYACGYGADRRILLPPAFLSREEVDGAIGAGYLPVAAAELFSGCRTVDPCRGLTEAATEKCGETVGAEEIEALYLRKSAAEEGR